MMETKLPGDDLELNEAFEHIAKDDSLSSYIKDIAELIQHGIFSRENLNKILFEYGIANIEAIKGELMDLLILFVKLVLQDNIISEKEKRNIKTLKYYFNIKEGDFLKYRKYAVKEILDEQFRRLYADYKIEEQEAVFNAELQGIFDMSFDQIDEFKENEVRNSLKHGAKITELDTGKYPKSL